MADFHLKAGTVVKHGTSSIHLLSILQQGLKPGHGRHELRKESEATPKLAAVYVGELSAYFAAYAAHMAVIEEFVRKIPDFTALAQAYQDDALRASRDLKVANVPLSVPVVLNIELANDVRLHADEDYLGYDSASMDDEQVWDRWRAGGILEDIPPSWIKSFEFPQLVSVDDYISGRRQSAMFGDAHYLLCGAMNVSNKIPPAKVPLPPDAKGLSQKWNFNEQEVKRFFACKPMATPEVLFLNQVAQSSCLQALAEELEFTGFQ